MKSFPKWTIGAPVKQLKAHEKAHFVSPIPTLNPSS